MAVTTKAVKVTNIDRGSVNALRGEINTALKNVLDKHGLIGVIGNITFSPGANFRCKLTVSQPKAPRTGPVATPKVGDVWLFGAKSYTIAEVRGADVVVENVNARPKWGRPAKRYRITIAKLQSDGTFLR